MQASIADTALGPETGLPALASLGKLRNARPTICIDLVGCFMNSNRARFERELCRLRGYRFKRLLVVGSRDDIAAGRYYSRIAPKAVLATLGAFEIRYVPVIFCSTPEEAAIQIERWAFYFEGRLSRALTIYCAVAGSRVPAPEA
jgi:hypothetical protein